MTAEGLIVRYEDGGRLEGAPNLTSTSQASYGTEEGDVEISDCGPESARMTIGAHSYSLERISSEVGPETWCGNGVHGFFGIAASYRRLTNYGPPKSEFETQAEYRARFEQARRAALARNRFLPILANVYLGQYDADRGGFQFSPLESDEVLGGSTSLELVDHQKFIIPVDIERARELRAQAGSSIRASVFMVVEVDQSRPVETLYDRERRVSYQSINVLRTVCMIAQFGDDE